MRVGIFFVIFTLAACGASFADNGFTLAVSCGAAGAGMAGYNDPINSANAYNTSLGIDSMLKTLYVGISPEIIMGYEFTAPVGLVNAYIRNSLTILTDGTSVAKWPNGITAQSVSSDLSVIYTGIGARISYAHESFSVLSGYAAFDAGLCHYYGNFMAEETYKEDGGVLHRIRKEWQTAVPGINAEAGLNWWFAGNTGITLKGGYRLAAGKVMVKIINIEGWTGPLEGEDYSDYSGFFANAGLCFRFEQPAEDSRKKDVKGGQFPDIALWLYNDAEELYTEGLYRQAAQKTAEAENAAPGNARIGELKEKILAVLKTENNAEAVKKFLKQADDYRDKKDYKKARMRYTEALAMDTENKQAKYYLDDFNAKAALAYAGALKLKQEGRFRDAMQEAKLAYDCGGSREAGDLYESLRAQLKNKKEQDRLFNEGVESYQKGDYKKASELWAEVLSNDPEDSDAAANLEKAGKKLASDSGGAKAAIITALKEAKDVFAIGNMEEAQKKCEYILRLDKGNTEAAGMIGEIKKLQEENKSEVINKR